MPKNVRSEINLHLVWHTKLNQPSITPEIEPALHRFLGNRALESRGVFVHAVDGTQDHVHMAVSVPPNLLVSDWIGKLKGSSSHYINTQIANRKILEWQVGYGVVSFGTGDLAWVKSYIENQKQHHATGKVYRRLESTQPEDDSGRQEEDDDGD
ncbi:MAG TPA: IS200/IS605 family transposase [Blastocatellia bacterium]|nr:IS200/IS605 family transposase [Blastocatellia bacterium]